MLENAKRQLVIVLLVLLGAIISYKVNGISLGLDLEGGTQLIYEVDPGEIEGPIVNPDLVMPEVVAIISARIDPSGTLDAVVTRRGQWGILIELPGLSEDQATAIENKITKLGSLEMRVVATADYSERTSDQDSSNVEFDLEEEKKRLQAWVDADGNKDKLLKAPLYIRTYWSLPEDAGGPQSSQQELRWYPHLVEALEVGTERSRFSHAFSVSRGELAGYTVALFPPNEYQAGPQKEGQTLLEYLPINMHEANFSGEDLDANGVRPGVDENGRPAVFYAIKPGRVGEYADLSEKYIQKHSAIILDKFIKSAPVYQSRIPGRGQITGFTTSEAQVLAEVLKRGSLKVQPEMQSKSVIGATLGQRSIELGQISLAVGAAMVLLFILFYYRTPGLVAFLAILLNIALVFGALSFIHATLTLPGLAGLVLTIGMAVDANILIYERIREEVKRGKALLQAVRLGFERAMSTILDANITTFLAGLVLYNVGVGPIRGFAVTLMVGILTSLFTAFFFSRLLFHYLIESKKMQAFNIRDWFGSLGFSFMRHGKVAFTFSIILIALGLINFARVPDAQKFGMDFTGGAELTAVTVELHSVQEIRKLLEQNQEFHADFPEPVINTKGEVKDGKAKRFGIKLKVDAELKKKLDEGREQAKQEGTIYHPPFQDEVSEALAQVLVSQAFDNEAIIDGGNPRVDNASIDVHYNQEVSVDRVSVLLKANKARGDDAQVSVLINGQPSPATAGSTTKNLRLEFDIGKGSNKEDLVEQTRMFLAELTDVNDQKTTLSNPIPDVSEIGGRMVGELRTAAIWALGLALFLIVMFIRIRFHEYKYGIAAVAALVHDVLIALGILVFVNYMGWVSAELNLSMIAAFLTIIGYSINDTIVIFDRVRENLSDQERLGDKSQSFAETLNKSINQTLARTILTSCTTLLVVLALFVVNYGSGSDLEGFAFAMMIGILTGTYSTIFIASPVVLWLRNREKPDSAAGVTVKVGEPKPEKDPAAIPAPAK